jgi:RNA polymerase sigma-70 factor, ECF subfamily
MSATAFSLETRKPNLTGLDAGARSELLREAREGDRESLAKLIVPFAPGLYRTALRLTRNPADAEDARQEAFLRAVARLEQFSGTQSESKDELQAWVSRIASNASIDVIRRRREGKILSLEDPSGAEESIGDRIADRDENPEARYARRETRRLLANAIAQLAPDLRQVCLLRDVLQYSTQEVADRLGVSAMAVRLRLFRAHRRLREKLATQLQPRSRKAALRPTMPQRRPVQPVIRRPETAIPMPAFAEYACGD